VSRAGAKASNWFYTFLGYIIIFAGGAAVILALGFSGLGIALWSKRHHIPEASLDRWADIAVPTAALCYVLLKVHWNLRRNVVFRWAAVIALAFHLIFFIWLLNYVSYWKFIWSMLLLVPEVGLFTTVFYSVRDRFGKHHRAAKEQSR
jgi:hypothetical protein